ncbi:HelD family protein [Kutzneria albida]|uniref:Superfamily I DNA and RNA helicase-like protein n=1 Tax=Kutzneria albida DSM 43870 TaxID=1449976 RepID=W5W995_9PSEU|nr:ATP-binding domain-containing protein [Kutzneria albida]AHH94759.1 Superfamily I DNA and RNA helicase-like protein [Kutzneria albida DSM 43870]
MSSHAEEELRAEQQYLVHAHACLRSSRAQLLELAERARARPGDEEAVAWLEWRAEQLRDENKSPLFFGRIDGPEPRPCYIGRRHVSDEQDEPVVIDWRTPMAARFYRASPGQPMEVTRRRRFGFAADGALTSFDDEPLTENSVSAGLSELVIAEIERTHVGPMRDIVATIQPDQDEIVRTELASTLIVQGGPGTGKTAVGLHRAAYLLFEHTKLRRSGVLVVGPNDLFVRYISRVLPALGESQVVHLSVDELVAAKRKPVPEAAEVAALKGDARMAQVLAAALWAGVRLPTEDTVVRESSPYVRIHPETVRELSEDLVAQRVPVARARAHLIERITAHVRRELETRGHAPSDADMRRIARAKSVRELAASVWPTVNPAQVLVDLFSDADLLGRAAEGVLTAEEQRLLLWPSAPASVGRAKWSLADRFLLDELASLVEPPTRFGHVVIDEAQDLSPLQLRAIMRRCVDSATLLGDMAQRTTPWAAGSWRAVAEHLGVPSRVLQLTTSYRVPRDIVRVANSLLPEISPELPPTVSGRHVPGALEVQASEDTADSLVELLRAAEQHPDSVGVVLADDRFTAVRRRLAAAGITAGLPHEDEAEHKFSLVPASLAKGLEFDHVVVLEPELITAAGQDGLRLLYIALTRAISRLTILHTGELPAALAAAR